MDGNVAEMLTTNQYVQILTNKDKTKVYCEVYKTVYVADKAFYKRKKQKQNDHKTISS